MVLGKSQPCGFWLSSLDYFSDRVPEVFGASAIMVQALKTICVNGKEWEDHMMAVVGMSDA